MSSVTLLEQKNKQQKAEIARLTARVEELSEQIKWFKNQLFGQKSERRIIEQNKDQLYLGEQFKPEEKEIETQTIKEHKRKKVKTSSKDGDNQKLFFDESVPVEEIKVKNSLIEGLKEDEYEIINQKETYKLAQRPSSYVILKYVRDVVKLKNPAEGEKQILCPAAPEGVFEKSHADVSFIAGLLNDKFQYHLPLYRQHQRLQQNGINVSRQWLTQLVHRACALLEPIYYALIESVRASRIKIIDETPVKAGRKVKGKMQTGYFWPSMGDDNEIVFFYFNSRNHENVFKILGETPDSNSVVVSDGYAAYQKYAEKTNTLNAQCWNHSRRQFISAENVSPCEAAEALAMIGQLYKIEDEIKKARLKGEKKLLYRIQHSRPIVEKFFKWVSKQQIESSLLPQSRLSKALNYVKKREEALRLFLTDPDIPLDTNEVEGNLRPIPLGRKNWLFCWSEIGAHYVAVIQSLIITCKLQNIDVNTYLIDVLQRVAFHPQADIAQLIPKNWKKHFASNPLTSDLKGVSFTQG